MNVAKEYGEIPSYHYYPEVERCLYCGGELEWKVHVYYNQRRVRSDEERGVACPG